MTKFVRAQLLVFLVLTVVSLSYVTYNYLGLKRVTGIGTYTVQAHFVDAAGLYENAIVTYRGIDVGLVRSVSVTSTDVVAELQIDSKYSIPASSAAAVKSVSAIGEQYVDFTPESEDGPFLVDGSTVSIDSTSVPTSTGTLLSNAQALLTSIPGEDLRTTIDESFDAFNGLGPDLARLLDSSQSLVSLALANVDPTIRLIEDSEPLLDTGIDVRPQTLSSVSDLNGFSEQLVMNDAQIRSTLDVGPGFADTVSSAFTQLQPALPMMLANLQTVGQVAQVNLPGIEHILVVYPALSSAVGNVFREFPLGGDPNRGQGPLDVKLGSTQRPAPCTEGFGGIERRDPSDTSPMDPNTDAYCTLPQDDPRAVRSARNQPCATDPSVRTAEVADCPRGLPSTWPENLASPNGANAPGQTVPAPAAAPAAPAAPVADPEPTAPESTTETEEGIFGFRDSGESVPYDPSTGNFFAPDGKMYTLSAVDDTNNGKELRTWQDLWSNPLTK